MQLLFLTVNYSSLIEKRKQLAGLLAKEKSKMSETTKAKFSPMDKYASNVLVGALNSFDKEAATKEFKDELKALTLETPKVKDNYEGHIVTHPTVAVLCEALLVTCTTILEVHLRGGIELGDKLQGLARLLLDCKGEKPALFVVCL